MFFQILRFCGPLNFANWHRIILTLCIMQCKSCISSPPPSRICDNSQIVSSDLQPPPRVEFCDNICDVTEFYNRCKWKSNRYLYWLGLAVSGFECFTVPLPYPDPRVAPIFLPLCRSFVNMIPSNAGHKRVRVKGSKMNLPSVKNEPLIFQIVLKWTFHFWCGKAIITECVALSLSRKLFKMNLSILKISKMNLCPFIFFLCPALIPRE